MNNNIYSTQTPKAPKQQSANLGQILRTARLEQGLSLKDVATKTRVRQQYLEALEENNYNALPESVYTRNFIRLYGSVLGLDSNMLLQRYTEQNNDNNSNVVLNGNTPTTATPIIKNQPISNQTTAESNSANFLGSNDSNTHQNNIQMPNVGAADGSTLTPKASYMSNYNAASQTTDGTEQYQSEQNAPLEENHIPAYLPESDVTRKKSMDVGRFLPILLLLAIVSGLGFWGFQNRDALVDDNSFIGGLISQRQNQDKPQNEDKPQNDANVTNIDNNTSNQTGNSTSENNTNDITTENNGLTEINTSNQQNNQAPDDSIVPVDNSDLASENSGNDNLEENPATSDDNNSTSENNSTGETDVTTTEVSFNNTNNDSTEGVSTEEVETVNLSIVTVPRGATISLDNYEFPEASPFQNAPVTMGENRILRISLAGYKTHEQTIDINRDRTISIILDELDGAAESEIIAVNPDEINNPTNNDSAETTEETNNDNEEENVATTSNNLSIEIVDGPSWLEIYQGDARGTGKTLLYRTAQAGETFEYTAPIYVFAGDAGKVMVKTGSGDARALGDAGEVTGESFAENTEVTNENGETNSN